MTFDTFDTFDTFAGGSFPRYGGMMTEKQDTEWVTTSEAADLTGYSIQYVRRLVRNGRVRAQKWVRDWMVDKEALLAYQQSMQTLGDRKYDPWRTGARKKEDGAE